MDGHNGDDSDLEAAEVATHGALRPSRNPNGRRGRPGPHKTEMAHFRLTVDEYDALCRGAGKAQLSLSEYCRYLVGLPTEHESIPGVVSGEGF